MSNSYKYIDPDFTYTDPKTGILRNLQDITDPDVLLFVESGAVTKRLQELYENHIKIKSIDSLFEIHRHLFQDIYVWAGKKRTVEISKDGKQFFPTSHFGNAFRYIDQLIAEFKKIPKDDNKLPTIHCPQPGSRAKVRTSNAPGWYFNVGSTTPSGIASKPPTYPKQTLNADK